MNRIALASALLIPVLALSACSSGTSTTSVTDVTAAQASSILDEPATKVIDVRTAQEFAGGHLPDAVNIDIESNTFDSRIAELPKDAKYFVYCRSGNRSGTATDRMSRAGFTSLYDLQGGIQVWANAGGQVVV